MVRGASETFCSIETFDGAAAIPEGNAEMVPKADPAVELEAVSDIGPHDGPETREEIGNRLTKIVLPLLPLSSADAPATSH